MSYLKSLNNNSFNVPDLKITGYAEGGVYITSNETGCGGGGPLSESIELIQKTIQNSGFDRGLHVGVSGFHNGDIACATQAKGVVIVDISKAQIRFMNQAMVHLLPECENRHQFVEKVLELAKKMMLKESPGTEVFFPPCSPYFQEQDEPMALTEIKDELNRKSSWLAADHTYNYSEFN